MRRQPKMFMWLGGIVILLVACGTTREARQEDKVLEDFKVALTDRQVARRRDTADRCHRQGVVLPVKYRQKGGGMLEEYVDTRPPCGITAQERVERAEADFRAAWKAVDGGPVPFEYEWLLRVKHRIATWLDTDGLSPVEARRTLREAQWVLAGWEKPPAPSPVSAPGSSIGGESQLFAGLDTALNRALVTEGITCRQHGERRPCF